MCLEDFIEQANRVILKRTNKRIKPFFKIDDEVIVKKDKDAYSYINLVIGVGKKGTVKTFENIPLIDFGNNNTYYVSQTNLRPVNKKELAEPPKKKQVLIATPGKVINKRGKITSGRKGRIVGIKNKTDREINIKYGKIICEMRESGMSFYRIQKEFERLKYYSFHNKIVLVHQITILYNKYKS